MYGYHHYHDRITHQPIYWQQSFQYHPHLDLRQLDHKYDTSLHHRYLDRYFSTDSNHLGTSYKTLLTNPLILHQQNQAINQGLVPGMFHRVAFSVFLKEH